MLDITKIDTSGWSKEQLAKLDELKAKQAEISQRKELLAAQEEAKRNDPATILEEEMARQEAEEAALKLKEREAKADVAYRQAVKKHGGKSMVARIRTEEGSIILHALSSGEFEALGERLKKLAEAEDPNVELIARDALREQVDFPPLPEFDELVTKYPGLWVKLVEARDALATGAARVTAGKG